MTFLESIRKVRTQDKQPFPSIGETGKYRESQLTGVETLFKLPP